MGKRGNSGAQGAKKKQSKAQKRKKRLGNKPEGLTLGAMDAAMADAPRDDLERLLDWVPLQPLVRALFMRWNPSLEGIQGLAEKTQVHPHEAAVTVDCPGCYPGVTRPPELWTRPKLAALKTDDILARLNALGVRVDQATFAEAARRRRSAWRLAREEWLAGSRTPLGVHGSDFLGLAAHELWKRWMPGEPSCEMLLEPLFEQRHATDTWEEADLGLAFWSGLKPVLTPEMRTSDRIDDLLEGAGDSFFNWSLDFAHESSAAADELGAPAADRLAGALGEMLDQLADEDNEWRYLIQRDRALIEVAAGMREEAERTLLSLTEQHPDKAAAYIALAELLTSPGTDEHAGIERAVTLLRKGLAALPEGEERDELEVLAEALCRDLARAKRDDAPPERRAAGS